MRPDKIVVAAKQLQVGFQSLFPVGMTYRPAQQIRGALSDREIQPFDERCVQFRGVFRLLQPLFKSPSRPNHRPSLHFHDAIIPTRLDDLTIDTGGPKDLADDFFIELESIRGNQRVLSTWQHLTGIGARSVTNEDLRPPLLFARPRRSEIARVDDSWISISVGQRETSFARHRGWTESAEPVAET